MNIVCFLCLRPYDLFLSFISKLKDKNYDIYVCVDDNKYIPDKKWDNIFFIQINNDICYASGYRSIVGWFPNRACSKDKALFYFNNNEINYDYIWFIEDDTFIPSINTIRNMDNKYVSIDFLTPPISNVDLRTWDWGEALIKKQFYFLNIKNNISYFNYYKMNTRMHTMTCAIRLSNKYMKCISDFVDKHGALFMDELFFMFIYNYNQPTLSIKQVEELNTITWNKDWKIKDININNLYHPIKDFSRQELFRTSLLDENA